MFSGWLINKYKSSHLQIFFKKGVVKKFLNIHRKISLLESLFNETAGFLKAQVFFFVNITKFFRKTFLENLAATVEDVLRNFAKYTGKHLCQSLFFNKVTGLFLRTPFFTKHLRMTTSALFTENLWTTVSEKTNTCTDCLSSSRGICSS